MKTILISIWVVIAITIFIVNLILDFVDIDKYLD